MQNAIHSYKDLIVWQKAMDLITLIYDFTAKFPSSERFGLFDQMRRSSVSIASNIAEGRRRGSRNDFKRFLFIAYSSGAELETQIEIAKRLNFGNLSTTKQINDLLDQVMRMLNSMLSQFNANKLKS